MTTAAEVRKWTQPLRERYPELALQGRNLVLRPVQHLLRGIAFGSSWSADYPRPRWYFVMLFRAPSPSTGLHWFSQLLIARSTEDDFIERLTAAATRAIESELKRVSSLEEFEKDTSYERDVPSFFGCWAIERYPQYHAPLLAALGHLDEAHAVLSKAVEKDEAYHLNQLAEGQALIAKRSNSRIGKDAVAFATYHLAIIAELKRLLVLLEARDRPAIGALLREWEQRNAKRWRVEHLWEPIPFPVEQGDH